MRRGVEAVYIHTSLWNCTSTNVNKRHPYTYSPFGQFHTSGPLVSSSGATTESLELDCEVAISLTLIGLSPFYQLSRQSLRSYTVHSHIKMLITAVSRLEMPFSYTGKDGSRDCKYAPACYSPGGISFRNEKSCNGFGDPCFG